MGQVIICIKGKPARTTFDWTELDKTTAFFTPPILSPNDRKKVKYVWLTLQDGMHDHEGLAMECFELLFQKYPGFLNFFETQDHDIRLTGKDPKDTPSTSSIKGQTESFDKKHSVPNKIRSKQSLQNKKPSNKNESHTNDETSTIPQWQSNKWKNQKDYIEANFHKFPAGASAKYFVNHLISISLAFEKVFALIDDTEQFMEFAYQIRSMHNRKVLDLGKAHFRVFFECMEATFLKKMGADFYRKQIRESTIIFFEYLYYALTFNMQVKDDCPRLVPAEKPCNKDECSDDFIE